MNKLKHAGEPESFDGNISGYCNCVSRVSYSLPAWYGHLLQADIGRINALFRKAHRWRLTDRTFTIEELGAETDIKLFNAIVGNPAHLLYHYYLHTDQLNIHYENGVTRSFYPPSVQHTSEQHS